jgi:hypothetical protein
MGIFFLIMPLAQTWLVRHKYKDFICQVMQQPYDIPLTSRQGRPHIAQISGRFKMVYIDGVHDSKDYGAINHFETTQYRPML